MNPCQSLFNASYPLHGIVNSNLSFPDLEAKKRMQSEPVDEPAPTHGKKCHANHDRGTNRKQKQQDKPHKKKQHDDESIACKRDDTMLKPSSISNPLLVPTDQHPRDHERGGELTHQCQEFVQEIRHLSNNLNQIQEETRRATHALQLFSVPRVVDEHDLFPRKEVEKKKGAFTEARIKTAEAVQKIQLDAMIQQKYDLLGMMSQRKALIDRDVATRMNWFDFKDIPASKSLLNPRVEKHMDYRPASASSHSTVPREKGTMGQRGHSLKKTDQPTDEAAKKPRVYHPTEKPKPSQAQALVCSQHKHATKEQVPTLPRRAPSSSFSSSFSSFSSSPCVARQSKRLESTRRTKAMQVVFTTNIQANKVTRRLESKEKQTSTLVVQSKKQTKPSLPACSPKTATDATNSMQTVASSGQAIQAIQAGQIGHDVKESHAKKAAIAIVPTTATSNCSQTPSDAVARSTLHATECPKGILAIQPTRELVHSTSVYASLLLNEKSCHDDDGGEESNKKLSLECNDAKLLGHEPRESTLRNETYVASKHGLTVEDDANDANDAFQEIEEIKRTPWNGSKVEKMSSMGDQVLSDHRSMPSISFAAPKFLASDENALLRRLFYDLDSNKDGLIDPIEAHVGMQRLGIQESPQRILAFFNQYCQGPYRLIGCTDFVVLTKMAKQGLHLAVSKVKEEKGRKTHGNKRQSYQRKSQLTEAQHVIVIQGTDLSHEPTCPPSGDTSSSAHNQHDWRSDFKDGDDDEDVPLLTSQVMQWLPHHLLGRVIAGGTNENSHYSHHHHYDKKQKDDEKAVLAEDEEEKVDKAAAVPLPHFTGFAQAAIAANSSSFTMESLYAQKNNQDELDAYVHEKDSHLASASETSWVHEVVTEHVLELVRKQSESHAINAMQHNAHGTTANSRHEGETRELYESGAFNRRRRSSADKSVVVSTEITRIDDDDDYGTTSNLIQNATNSHDLELCEDALDVHEKDPCKSVYHHARIVQTDKEKAWMQNINVVAANAAVAASNVADERDSTAGLEVWLSSPRSSSISWNSSRNNSDANIRNHFMHLVRTLHANEHENMEIKTTHLDGEHELLNIASRMRKERRRSTSLRAKMSTGGRPKIIEGEEGATLKKKMDKSTNDRISSSSIRSDPWASISVQAINAAKLLTCWQKDNTSVNMDSWSKSSKSDDPCELNSEYTSWSEGELPIGVRLRQEMGELRPLRQWQDKVGGDESLNHWICSDEDDWSDKNEVIEESEENEEEEDEDDEEKEENEEDEEEEEGENEEDEKDSDSDLMTERESVASMEEGELLSLRGIHARFKDVIQRMKSSKAEYEKGEIILPFH